MEFEHLLLLALRIVHLLLISTFQSWTNFCCKKKQVRKRKTCGLGRLKDPKEGKKCTKCGNSPRTWQPRHLAPNVVKNGLPTLSIDEEVYRLLVTKERREIMDNPRCPIWRLKLKIPIVGWGFQTVKVQKLV